MHTLCTDYAQFARSKRGSCPCPEHLALTHTYTILHTTRGQGAKEGGKVTMQPKFDCQHRTPSGLATVSKQRLECKPSIPNFDRRKPSPTPRKHPPRAFCSEPKAAGDFVGTPPAPRTGPTLLARQIKAHVHNSSLPDTRTYLFSGIIEPLLKNNYVIRTSN